MEDVRSVLSQFKGKFTKDGAQNSGGRPPTLSSIPDLFFDEILLKFKLSRIEILVLMYLYRQVWTKTNLNKKFGIGPINSFKEMSLSLHFDQKEVVDSIHSLERHGLIQTVRVGQYFVRKFFTEDFDLKYGQSYDEFF